MKDFFQDEDPNWRIVYTPYFIHWRSKKKVYRKDGGMFRFRFPKK